jgi:hypothetical protein
MMKRILALSIGATILCVGAPSCTQPPIDCTTGHGGFAMRYTPKAGTKQGMGTCDQLKGEIVGLEKYNPASTDDPNKQDLTKATLAMRSSKIGQLAVDNGIDDPKEVDSQGSFDSTTPANDVCTVRTLTPAELNLDDKAKGGPIDVKYEWSNVRVYVTTAYEGTEVVADLKYTENGCSAEYTVLGLWPAVSCEKADDMGKGTGMPDTEACNPVATGDRATGSGINPDFKDNITCDPDLLLCVLKSIPDPLK